MELFKILGTIAIDNAGANKALSDTSKKAKDSAKDIDDFGDSGEKSSGKLSKFFSGVGKAAGVAAKGIAVGLGAAATAIVGIGTSAVKAYSEYEQLVGGVETLFGTRGAQSVEDYAKMVGESVDFVEAEFGMLQQAQSAVMANAAEAYKTAGMSANEYMETANGLAAALNQSSASQLESAELANQAIIDMSDNAAKMGTDLESIKTAYAGFAKQNYTMLDNLKLGYGGTKEEMQRLLDDASKISGIKYDLSSFADVTEAIHVMQEEMGIAGTTAAEASGTIQGSLGMLKGSWENLMIGLTDPDQDLTVLFQNVFDSLVTFSSNLIPRITQVLTGLTQAINQLVPMVVGEIPGLVQQILPPLIEGATALIQGLVDVLPGILNTLMAALPALIEGVMSIVDALIGALPGILEAIVAALPALIPQLIDAVVGLIMMLIEMLPQIIQPIIDYLPEIIVSIVDALLGNLPVLIQGCVQLIAGLIAALPQILVALWDTIKGIFGSLGNMIGGWFEPIKNTVSEKCENIKAAASEKFSAMVEAVKGFFVQLGKNLVSFFTSTIPNLIAQIGKWFNELPGKIGYALGYVIGKLVAFGSEAVNWVKTNVPKIINNIITFFKELPEKVWTWLKNTISKITTWGSEMASKAKTAASNFVNNAVNTIKNLPGNIQTWLTNVINKVVSFGKDMAAKGKEAASNLFNAIVNKVKELPGKMLSIGKDIVTGLWNGIKNAKDWIVGKVKDFAGGILDGMKDALGIKSPSRRFRDEVGKMIAEGVAVGIEENTDKVESATDEMSAKIIEAAEKRLDEYQKYNELTLADEVAFWDSVRTQCAEGTDARLSAEKKYLEAKKSLNEQILEADKQLQNSLDEINQSIVDRTNDILKNTNFGEAKHFDEYLDTLKHEVFGLEQYDKTMADLEKKIGGTAAFDAIKSGGLENLNMAYELAYFMPEDKLVEYVELWDRKVAKASSIAQSELAEEVTTKTTEVYGTWVDTMGALGVEVTEATGVMNEEITGDFAAIEGGINNVGTAFKNLVDLFTSFDWSSVAPMFSSWFAGSEDTITDTTSMPYGSLVKQGTAYYSAKYGESGDSSDGLEYVITETLTRLVNGIYQSFKNVKVYLDTGVLVGELVVPMDQALGKLTVRKDRGR